MSFSNPPSFSRFGLQFHLTKAVKYLLIINIAVFLLELIIGRVTGGLKFLLENFALSFEHTLYKGKVWQVVTYMFLHDPMGISHILWNMLMLWLFGSPLERFWGERRFVKFYLLTGVYAAIVVLAVALCIGSQRDVSTLGASGALYALLIAFAFNFPNALIYLFGLFPIKGKHLVLLFIALGIVQSLTLGGSNVSTAAHFGGMLAGFLLVTGAWRPSTMVRFVRIWFMKLKYRKLRKHIHVIDKDNDKPYMN